MYPVLFSFKLPLLGEVVFPAYFTLLTIGFAFAIVLSSREARRLGIDANKIVDLNLYMLLFGLIGARLLHVFVDGHFMEYVHRCTAPEVIKAVGPVPSQCATDAQCAPYFLCNKVARHCYPPRDCLLALKFWTGGLTYYGGFIFASIAGFYFLRKNRIPFWPAADLAGFGIPIGLFWGRLGCFLNGCCFGKLTHSPLGVTFLKGGAAWRHQVETHLISASTVNPLPVHPTQLYESILSLGIFCICYFVIRPRKRFDGQVFWWFVLLYSVVRSIIELFRDDDRGVLAGIISTSQIISIPLFFLAIYMLWSLPRRFKASGC